jgi:hypothetical protein
MKSAGTDKNTANFDGWVTLGAAERADGEAAVVLGGKSSLRISTSAAREGIVAGRPCS